MSLNTDLNIKSKGISARINNEINNLFNQSELVSSERKENTILLKIVKDKNTYEMCLPKDYPFKMPINITYNGIEYKKSLFTYSEKIKNVLKTNYNTTCLCCSSILCSEWGPINNVSNIINEMMRMSQIKKEIKIRLLCDMVREKFKCYFAEFEKYLLI